MLAAIGLALVLQAPNTLTPAEQTAGWKLLFDGRTTNGWRNHMDTGIRPGWVVRNGALVCANPDNAGDIVTADKFGWFELKLEFNLTPGGNSGVMFHVADTGGMAWQSGPEVQIFDHGTYPNPQKTGWLYELYESKVDASKPAGQWNEIRLLISKEKCQVDVNGTKYYEFVLGSEEFKARLAKSKFGEMPHFAKVPNGRIALQGDHGVVSFRNIKIRPIAE
jgi:hypothetical protein